MRLVQVAKILGMTGQDLRHELSQVNFGVKPTDREVPDGLAKGIIRFVAQKKGLNIDLESLNLTDMGDEEEGSDAPVASTPAAPAAPVAPLFPGQQSSKDVLPVLRKLTLEDVPREAIVRQATALRKTKAEIEADRRDARDAAIALKKKQSENATVHQEQIKKKVHGAYTPMSLGKAVTYACRKAKVPNWTPYQLRHAAVTNWGKHGDPEAARILAGHSDLGTTRIYLVDDLERAAKFLGNAG
jgi:polyribonucleotide nucleotidyltransferase